MNEKNVKLLMNKIKKKIVDIIELEQKNLTKK